MQFFAELISCDLHKREKKSPFAQPYTDANGLPRVSNRSCANCISGENTVVRCTSVYGCERIPSCLGCFRARL
jgi:hypothetical protein